MAAEVGFEPTARRLTAGCSTAELLDYEEPHMCVHMLRSLWWTLLESNQYRRIAGAACSRYHQEPMRLVCVVPPDGPDQGRSGSTTMRWFSVPHSARVADSGVEPDLFSL